MEPHTSSKLQARAHLVNSKPRTLINPKHPRNWQIDAHIYQHVFQHLHDGVTWLVSPQPTTIRDLQPGHPFEGPGWGNGKRGDFGTPNIRRCHRSGGIEEASALGSSERLEVVHTQLSNIVYPKNPHPQRDRVLRPRTPAKVSGPTPWTAQGFLGWTYFSAMECLGMSSLAPRSGIRHRLAGKYAQQTSGCPCVCLFMWHVDLGSVLISRCSSGDVGSSFYCHIHGACWRLFEQETWRDSIQLAMLL